MGTPHLVLISLKSSAAINWQNRIMLHWQARVIVLIILLEMHLIKKKNTVFPEVHLQYLAGISTEFIGINQTNCFTQKLLTNLWMPRMLSTCTMGLPLDVCISFSKADDAIFPFHLKYPYLSIKKQHQPFLILHSGKKVWGTAGCKDVSVNCSSEENISQWIYTERKTQRNLVTTKSEKADYFSMVT